MPSSDDPRTEGRGLPLLDDQLLISVAVPRPLLGLFTYRISSVLAAQVKVGGWVKVPFGRSLTVAFVVEPPRPMSDIPVGLTLEQLKEVTEVSEPEVALPLEVLQLCRWTQDYTFSPLGEVLNCAAPAAAIGLKKMKRPPKQVRVSVSPSSPLYALTSEQNRAVQAIEECRSSTKTHVILLQGVTGSGKTDVYIEYAKKVLTQGKGVLILVPEIALTPQLHQRFESGLGVPVALWHSAVSPSKRRDHAVALQTGEVRTVVGARSAVFAPVQNLGLVVVDEEHDPTYKQEDRVRYHARDLAVVRAKLAGAVVVLGSATPSLETRERVREERYLKTSLNKRFATGGLPQIDLVDLKIEEKVENIQAPLAKRTLEAIQKEIDSGGQVIVYLNRRGFASFLLCKDCGEVSQCLHCSVSLTVHKQAKQMRCHQCGFHHSIPDACSKCHGDHLFAMGAGTESLEGELPTLLQGVKVIRLDRDQITSATRAHDLISQS